jgi:hypothetical protein
VSGPIVDAQGFVVNPTVTRDFMTKFWISASIAFRKIENGHKPKKGLKLDVPTRWNSTFFMLEG